MKYQNILASLFCIFGLLSCIQNESIEPEITGYVYNRTTGLPEKDVKVTIYLVPRHSEGYPNEFHLTDSLGCYYQQEYKRTSIKVNFLAHGNDRSISYCDYSEPKERCQPVILEKEGYLPDSIYLEYDNITSIGRRSELIDTLYFSARIDPDYKAKEE